MTVGGQLDTLTGVGRSTAWDGQLSLVVRAGFDMVGGDDLVPVPDTDSEGVWAAAKNRIGTVVGLLQESMKPPQCIQTRGVFAAVQALRQLTATTSSLNPTLMVKERGLQRRTA